MHWFYICSEILLVLHNVIVQKARRTKIFSSIVISSPAFISRVALTKTHSGSAVTRLQSVEFELKEWLNLEE